MNFQGLTELNIFRGTYKECMAKETRDMTIYLAWDTQEIFVGNRQGVKVKYGGSRQLRKEIDRYFDEFRQEIYKDVSTQAVNTVEARIKEFEDKYNDVINNLKNEIITTIELYVTNEVYDKTLSLKADITSINSKLKTTDENIGLLLGADDEIRSICESLSKRIDDEIISVNAGIEFAKNQITNQTDKKLADLEDRLTGKINDNSNIDVIIGSLDENKAGLSNLKKRVDEIEPVILEIPALKEQNTTITNVIGDHSSRLSEVETDSLKHEEDITSINNSIIEISTDIEENTKLISDVATALSDLKAMSFGTGDAIKIVVDKLGAELNRFTPTLCVKDGSDYEQGLIYYYSEKDGKIVSVAVGGGQPSTPIVKVEKNVGLTLRLAATSSKRYKISSENITIMLEGSLGVASVIKNARITRSDNDEEYSISNMIENFSRSMSVPGAEDKTFIFTLNADLAVAEDDYYIYKLTPSSVSVTLYKPFLVKSGEIINDLDENVIEGKSFKASITPGEKVFIYSPRQLSEIVSSGFTFPVIYHGFVEANIEVNGVPKVKYHIYESEETINDTEVSLVVTY